MSIINAFIEITKKEPNLVYVPEPVVIVGDIHGQYYDLVHMINKAGDPSKMNYLFLGDYVDRGIFGLDVMLLLMAIKINYPKSFLLLRGNHESRNMTECFTFREEVISRFDEETYDKFMEVFDNLPLSCLIDGKYLAMHGGISPNLEKISQIDEIDRFQEVPLDGMFCDILWADPMKDNEAKAGTWTDNPERECSHYFGKKPVKKLLRNNSLLSIFRGHQV
jgi:serine/threonine-protein phosphatase 2B catalytic subunit